MAYDRDGRLANMVDAAGRQTRNVWNVDGTLDKRGVYLSTAGGAPRIQEWSYAYDALERQTRQGSISDTTTDRTLPTATTARAGSTSSATSMADRSPPSPT